MWDQRYNRDEYVYGTEPNSFLSEQSHRLSEDSQILTLCEGEGRNAVYLAGLGHQVTGVDGSTVGLEKARKLAALNAVEIKTRVTDLSHFEPGNSCWDAVVSIFAHVPPVVRQQIHKRVVRALRPGGLLILEAYTPEQIGRGTGGPPDEKLMMNLESLEEELDGLEFLLAEEKLRPVNEGFGHTGDGHVVQLIAKKPGTKNH